MKKKILFTLLLMTILVTGCSKSNSTVREAEKKEPEKVVYYAPLSGEVVEEDISKEPVFAVMLNNHPKALPQSALNDAEIIYEFKAEGEYTRFMALFMKNHPNVIGSVRSARPYYVNTAAEYNNAIYTHWGGSDAGYNQISKVGIPDLDGITLEGTTFYRNKEVHKKRPHDGYTSYDLIFEKAKELGYLDNPKTVEGFKFDHSADLKEVKAEMGDVEATKISLDFFKHHNMTFEYTPDNNSYIAIRNGENVVDERDNSNVLAKNIIVEFAKSYISGPKETLTIEHIGSGEGKLFTNGKVIDITWEKPSETAKTVFKTLDGKEIILTPGLTFVEVLDPTDPVTIEPAVETENESTPAESESKN